MKTNKALNIAVGTVMSSLLEDDAKREVIEVLRELETPRKAYEAVLRNELDIMVEEKGLNIPQERRDSLAVELADSSSLLPMISETVEEYLEDFGENHDLYDLFD